MKSIQLLILTVTIVQVTFVTAQQVCAYGGYACVLDASDSSVRCLGLGNPPPVSTTWLSIQMMNKTICGIMSDQTIHCPHDRIVTDPFLPMGGHKFTSLSAGATYACGIRTNQALHCFGAGMGQLTAPGTFTQAAVGDSFDCALQTNQQVLLEKGHKILTFFYRSCVEIWACRCPASMPRSNGSQLPVLDAGHVEFSPMAVSGVGAPCQP